MNRGIFISFEGTDGSGKSTQAKFLFDYLKEKGFDPFLTREPGGTAISEMIRAVLLDSKNSAMTPETEALLYAASRAQLCGEKIIPALKKGRIVLCDRFIDSSIAYQGYARGLGDDVRKINEFAAGGVLPDITFFLDILPEKAMARINAGGFDRLESEGESFQKKVYEGYLAAMKNSKKRFVRIDASKSPEAVAADIRKYFDGYVTREFKP